MQKNNAKKHKFITFFSIYSFLQFFELLLIFVFFRNLSQDHKIHKFTDFYAFFAMHQNLGHFLDRTAENLQWPKVNFITVNLPG